jgi:drug/metabolite transporter (DMT)-like permease
MLLWGFNFVALKIALGEMSAPSAALIRGVLMYMVLIGVCFVTGHAPFRFPAGTAWRISLQGFLAMGVYMVLFVGGMKDASPAEGAILLGCSPLFTMILACLFRQESFRWSILAGTVLAFSGVAIVVTFSPAAQMRGGLLLGHFLLLASAGVWALATVVSKPIVAKVNPLHMLTLSMPGGLVALLVYGLPDVLKMDYTRVSPLSWAMMGYFAILAGVVGFILFYRGVREVGAAGAMLYQYLVAPTAALSGFLVLNAPFHAMQFVGLVVVLAGVTAANLARQKHGKSAVSVE